MDVTFAPRTIDVPMSEWTVGPPMDFRNAEVDFQYRVGVRHYRSHRWYEATEVFQRALEIDPHRGEVRLALGACLLHLDRPEEAMAHFDRAGAGALNERALFGKAVALQRLGRLREAEAAYTRLLASDARNKEALSNLIALYAAAHDFENVRHYALRLIEIAPDSMAALQGLAAASLDSREYESAFRYCSRIVERTPECVEAWHNLRLASGHVETTLRMAAAASQSTSQSTGRK